MICKNCHTELVDNADYCHNCGAKIIRKRLTFRNLFEHLSETFFNYDNKLLRTLIALMTKPVDVIDGYVSGIRKKYVNPLSLLGLALTLSGLSLFILRKFYLNDIDFSMYIYDERNTEQFEGIQSFLFEYNSIFFTFLIPFFALISWLVFLNKRYNYTEHNVLFFYTMSLMSILSVVVGQICLWIDPQLYAYNGMWFFLVLFIYHSYIYKKLFKLNWISLFLKTLLFLLIFTVFYVGASVLAFILMLVTGQINIEDFVNN